MPSSPKDEPYKEAMKAKKKAAEAKLKEAPVWKLMTKK